LCSHPKGKFPTEIKVPGVRGGGEREREMQILWPLSLREGNENSAHTSRAAVDYRNTDENLSQTRQFPSSGFRKTV